MEKVVCENFCVSLQQRTDCNAYSCHRFPPVAAAAAGRAPCTAGAGVRWCYAFPDT